MIKGNSSYWNQIRAKSTSLIAQEGVKKYKDLSFVNSAVTNLRIEENETNETHQVSLEMSELFENFPEKD